MSAPADAVQSALRPAGPVAAVIHEMTGVLTVGATLVFLVVMGVLAAALWRSIRRRADPAATAARFTDGPAARRSARRWILGAGLAFPLAVLLPLLVYATWRTEALTPDRAGPPSDELVITVRGRLWWWEVTYRDPVRGLDVTSANQIDLPVGRPVTLALISDDVIHSFWVPPLAGKVDLVPGRIHHLRLQADRAGVYRGACAEFCGEQHARMAIHVVAQPAADFDRWLAAQAAPAAVVATSLADRIDADTAAAGATPAGVAPAAAAEATGPAGAAVTGADLATIARGRAVFEERRCAACHTVRGVGPESRLGPDLTHLASRRHLAAGTLPMDRASLAAWIADPQRVKPGARMPSYDLDAAAMDALVTFLEQLR